ncbi:MAG: right-handed parallel beta-helix repeat-containing protein [Promethearchaeota archaeon]
MKQKIVIKCLILTLLILASTSTVFSPNFTTPNIHDKFNKNNLKMGYSWTLIPFIIDDTGGGDYTWSQAAVQPWCSGLGTKSDPYIINDISISGYMRNEHCLEIRNSEAFFVINNSRFWKMWGGYHGLVFSNVTNGLVINNDILDTSETNSRGIHMSDISNVSLKNNQVYDIHSYDGIRIENGDRISLINNKVYNTGGVGFDLVNMNNCTISNNEIYTNDHGGFNLINCNENNVSKNNIYDNQQWGNGIWVEYSNLNNISQNTIINNGATGIVIEEGSNDNIIKENILRDNEYYGISVGGVSDKPKRNLIYNNFFITNVLGHAAISILYSETKWDNGSLGNYWDDYTGYDGDGDGIGDTPYIINDYYSAQDNYPIWINKIVISIHNPTQNQIFEEIGPEFNIEIIDGTPDKIWYTLGDNTTKHFITSNGTINQKAWDWCADGDIIIRFSANNSLDNIGFSEVTVNKDTNAPIVSIISPEPYEKFGNITLMYVISLTEQNLDSTWYSINGVNYTFTNLIGKIDQGAWDSCENGTISIKFYANDTLGRVSYQELVVLKDINYIRMWNLSGVPIYIDNSDPNYNWAKIESENPWCRGSGTVLDPYIIENVIIDGYTNDSCITVLNSNVHFIIQNCELFNGVKRGIWLNNTQNGIIIHNIIHDNQYQGIYLWENCEWNQILNNEIFNHSGNGISFYMYCDYNIISENDITDNTDDGIGFFQYCTDNVITYNNISNSGQRGISLGILGSRTEITGNYINNNERGIFIDGGYDCIIERNRVSFHTYEGMDLFIFNSLVISNIVYNNSDGIGVYTEERPSPYINIFMNNIIINNTDRGLSIGTPSGQDYLNLIYKNSFINNGQHGFNSGGINSWDNGSIGNYWDDYSGNDLNDDGIGDIAYQISGIPSPKYDLYPIWDDGDDPTPPQISIILPTENQLFGKLAPNFRVSVTGLYLNITWYSLIGGSVNHTFTDFNDQIDQNLWDEFGNGTVVVRFYANDSLGHIGFDEIILLKDIISPNIIIYTPKNNEIFGISPPNYEIFINESNFDKSWYTFDNGQTNTTFFGNGTFAFNSWNNLPNGTVFIKFYACDKAGNIGFSEVKVYKDIIAPEIEILSPYEFDLFGSDAPEFEVFFNDPHINLTWYSLGAKNYTFTSNGTIDQEAWDLIMNGSVVIAFFINDSVGNIGHDQVLIRKDILAPIIEIKSPELDEIFSFTAPEFELSIIEGNLDTIWYSIDNGITNLTINHLVGTINQTGWNNKADGYIQIYFFANDTLGHIGHKNITILKDTEAPSILFEVSNLFINPFIPEYYHLNLEIKCTIFNSSEILWVYLCENSTGIPINHSMIYMEADDWVYNLDISTMNYGDSFSIMFIANDTVGNIGINDNMGSLFTIEIFDLQKPSTTISFDPHSDLFNVNKSTLFSLIADDNSGSGISIIMYQINDSEWFTFSQPFNLTDYNFGEWKISFYSIDNAGNVEDVNIITVNLIDTTPPDSPQNIPGYTPIIILGVLLMLISILTKKSKILEKNT